jgi:hypothetical protein
MSVIFMFNYSFSDKRYPINNEVFIKNLSYAHRDRVNGYMSIYMYSVFLKKRFIYY